MKKPLIALSAALMFSLSASAGSHVETLVAYSIPTSQNPVAAPKIASVRYQNVVVSEHETGNCDPVSNNGDAYACHTISQHAYRVRITLEYVSPAGANPTPEANELDANAGPVQVSFDLDPSKFDAATFARIRSLRNAKDLFALTASVAPTTTSVVDYDRSSFCSPEADSSCENQIVTKQIRTSLTTLSVSLR